MSVLEEAKATDHKWNVWDFIKENIELCGPPVLEIGSCDYDEGRHKGGTPDCRGLFPSWEYLGCDAVAGSRVDVVVDFTASYDELRAALGQAEFGTILCLHVLEHCRKPWVMAENIMAFLAPGGLLVVAVPWVYGLHNYPADYWRFSPNGVRILFAGLDYIDGFYGDKYRTTRHPINVELTRHKSPRDHNYLLELASIVMLFVKPGDE